jgi:hypothetical protein
LRDKIHVIARLALDEPSGQGIGAANATSTNAFSYYFALQWTF